MREVIILLGKLDIPSLVAQSLLSDADAFVVVQSDNPTKRHQNESDFDFLYQINDAAHKLLATAQALPRQGREHPLGRTHMKQNWPIKPAFVPTDRLHRRGIRHG